MNEKGTKRREWVKTAAIIFLSVMLVLTFFSNTIMNYSLPEVAAQYVQSGTITAKIRGTGAVESGDPYEVKTKLTGRTIESVQVKAGDTVQKGDVLFVLQEGEESEDLTAAKDKLELAEITYELALKKAQAAFLTGGLSEEVYHNMQAGVTTSYTEYYNRMLAAEAKIDEYEKRADEIANKIKDVTNLKDNLGYDVPNTTAEEQAYNAAKAEYDKRNAEIELRKQDLKTNQEELYAAEKLIRDYNLGLIDPTVSGSDITEDDIAEARKKVEILPNLIKDIGYNISSLEKALEPYKAEMDKKKADLDNKTENKGSINALTRELGNWQKEQAANEAKLKEAQEARDQIVKEIGIEMGGEGIDLSTPRKELEDAREAVQKLEGELVGGVVEAPISGIISSVSVVAGNKTSDEAGAKVLAVMQPEGKGFTLSFSVTNEQAKRVAVGDRAELVNAWQYDDVTVTLASIKPDKNEPGQKKLLTFDVTGSVTAGQTLNLSVGQKSANYDCLVPNSAVREDNNGKFILIVETKPSPLGNRYYASRVDVEVIASDDKLSAVNGALEGYEFVITTSTAPVEAGQLVRLAEN